MTKEQEQAIKVLEQYKKECIEEYKVELDDKDNIDQPHAFYLHQQIEAVYTVLNMLEEKDKEIRNLKDEINDAWGEWNDLEQTAYEEETRLKTELEKKDKIINLMAEAFKQDDARSVEEIIEYFENKAKGE